MKTKFNTNTARSFDPDSLRVDTFRPISKELDTKKDGLSFLNRVLLDSKLNKEAKKVIQESAVQMYEARKQELIARITLGLDEAKQRALVEHMTASEELSKEISVLSAELTDVMTSDVHMRTVAAAREEKQKLDEIEDLHSKGMIPSHRYESLKQSSFNAVEKYLEVVNAVADKIIEGHLQKISVALEIFKERQLAKSI